MWSLIKKEKSDKCKMLSLSWRGISISKKKSIINSKSLYSHLINN